MKAISSVLSTFVCLFFCLANPVFSQQNTEKPSVAVLEIDVKGFTMNAVQAGNLTRTELSKLGLFDVMDDYDVQSILQQSNLVSNECYGKLCLLKIGKALNVDKMLTGSAEVQGEAIVVTFRLLDVGTEEVEKTHVMEFLNLRQQVQSMIQLTLRKMFDLEVDNDLLTKLTKKFDYENAINTPEVSRLNLSGPRMGALYMTGDLGKVFEGDESKGGFDMYPVLFQFGYQFEVKYLNQGDFQALFEFVPVISGLDQGKFIPSMSFLNGMRSNRSGWEFAFGPIIYMTRKAQGYYIDGNWKIEEEVENVDPSTLPDKKRRIDSRGPLTLDTRFVFSVGKTLKSGNLNIPINAFFIPDKFGHRIGISVGYNAGK